MFKREGETGDGISRDPFRDSCLHGVLGLVYIRYLCVAASGMT